MAVCVDICRAEICVMTYNAWYVLIYSCYRGCPKVSLACLCNPLTLILSEGVTHVGYRQEWFSLCLLLFHLGAWADITQMDVLFDMTRKISHINQFSDLSSVMPYTEQLLTIEEQWWEKWTDERWELCFRRSAQRSICVSRWELQRDRQNKRSKARHWRANWGF